MPATKVKETVPVSHGKEVASTSHPDPLLKTREELKFLLSMREDKNLSGSEREFLEKMIRGAQAVESNLARKQAISDWDKGTKSFVLKAANRTPEETVSAALQRLKTLELRLKVELGENTDPVKLKLAIDIRSIQLLSQVSRKISDKVNDEKSWAASDRLSAALLERVKSALSSAEIPLELAQNLRLLKADLHVLSAEAVVAKTAQIDPKVTLENLQDQIRLQMGYAREFQKDLTKERRTPNAEEQKFLTRDLVSREHELNVFLARLKNNAQEVEFHSSLLAAHRLDKSGKVISAGDLTHTQRGAIRKFVERDSLGLDPGFLDTPQQVYALSKAQIETADAALSKLSAKNGADARTALAGSMNASLAVANISAAYRAYEYFEKTLSSVKENTPEHRLAHAHKLLTRAQLIDGIGGSSEAVLKELSCSTTEFEAQKKNELLKQAIFLKVKHILAVVQEQPQRYKELGEIRDKYGHREDLLGKQLTSTLKRNYAESCGLAGKYKEMEAQLQLILCDTSVDAETAKWAQSILPKEQVSTKPRSAEAKRRARESLKSSAEESDSDSALWAGMKQTTAELQRAPMSLVKRWAAGGAIAGCVGGAIVGGIPGCAVGGLVGLGGGPTALGVLTALSPEGRNNIAEAFQTKLSSISTGEAALNLVGSALDLADGIGVGVALKVGLTMLLKQGAIKALVRGLREDLRNPLRVVLREQLMHAGLTSVPLNSSLDDMLQVATNDLVERIRDVGGAAVDVAGTGNLLYALGQFANGFVQLESSPMADGDRRRGIDNLNNQVTDLALFLFVSHKVNKGFTGAIDTKISNFSVEGVKSAIREFREDRSTTVLNLSKVAEARDLPDIDVHIDTGVERSMFVTSDDVRHASSDTKPHAEPNPPEGQLRESKLRRTDCRGLDPADPRSLDKLRETYRKLDTGLKEEAKILEPDLTLNAIEYANAIIDKLQAIPEFKRIQPLNFRVLISDDPYPNALVTFGSKTGTFASASEPLVVLTRGLLQAAENEDQLAFIIYHEIAHAVNKNKLDFALCRIIDEISADALAAQWMDRVGYEWRQSRTILENMHGGTKRETDEEYMLRKLVAAWDEHPDLAQRIRNTNTHMGQLIATNRTESTGKVATALPVDLQKAYPSYEYELVTEAKMRGFEAADVQRKAEIIKEISDQEFKKTYPASAIRWKGILTLLRGLPELQGNKAYEAELHKLGNFFFNQLVNVDYESRYSDRTQCRDAHDVARAIFNNYQLTLISKVTEQAVTSPVADMPKVPVGIFNEIQSKAIELLQTKDMTTRISLGSELYKLMMMNPTTLIDCKKLLNNLRFPELEDALIEAKKNGQAEDLIAYAQRSQNPELATALYMFGFHDSPILISIIGDADLSRTILLFPLTTHGKDRIDIEKAQQVSRKAFEDYKIEKQLKRPSVTPDNYAFHNVREILEAELVKFDARLKAADAESDPDAARKIVQRERYAFLTEFAEGFLALRERTPDTSTPVANDLPIVFSKVILADFGSGDPFKNGPDLRESDLDHPFLLFIRSHSDRPSIQSFQLDFTQYLLSGLNHSDRKISMEPTRLHSILGIPAPKDLDEAVKFVDLLQERSRIFKNSSGLSPIVKMAAVDIERVLTSVTNNNHSIPTDSLLKFLVHLNGFDQRLTEVGSSSLLTSGSAKILSEQICPSNSQTRAQRERDYHSQPIEKLLKCMFELSLNKKADDLKFILSIFDDQLSSLRVLERLDRLKNLLSISNFQTSDPGLVKKYQTQYVDSVADILQKDPGVADPGYVHRAENFVSVYFSPPLPSSFSADCIDQLLIKITAQAPTARKLEQVAKEARYGESKKTHLGLKALEILLDKSAEDRDARLRVIDFLTTELTEETRDAFVKDLMSAGESGPFTRVKIPGLTVRQRPERTEVDWHGEKDEEYTKSRVESMYNFFWSSTFEARSAILGQLIVDKSEHNRQLVIWDVLSRICRFDLDKPDYQLEYDSRYKYLNDKFARLVDFALVKPIEAVWGKEDKDIPPIVLKLLVPPLDFVSKKLIPGSVELLRRFEDHPVRSQEDRWTETFLTSYLKGCEPEEQMVILGAFLAGVRRGKTESGINYGEVLAEVLESLGPAYVKLGQAISSSSSVPESIRQSLMRLKSRAAAPGRLELLNRIENVVPPELKGRIVHTGDVLGSASFFVSVEVMYRCDDGVVRPMVLSILREDAKDRAKRGFNKLLGTAKQLAEEDGPFKESGNLIISLVEQASGLTDIETDLDVGALQRKRARELYGDTLVSVDGEKMEFNVMRWISHGGEFRLAEKAVGVSFAKIVKEGLLPPERIKKLAKGHLAMELRNILRGGMFDEDRHSEQNSVNESQFNLFDHGAMSLRNPNEVELRQAGNLFAALLSTTEWEKDIPAIVSKQIQEHPDAKDYILHIQRGLLALNDFRRVLDRNELLDVFRGVVGSGEVHPTFMKAIEERLLWNPVLRAFLNIHGQSSIGFSPRSSAQESPVH